MSNGFDLAARQICREHTIEGLDISLEQVLFQALVAGNMPVDAVLAALERWAQLICDGYFEMMWEEDGQHGDLQFPRTREGREFLEKIALVRRLIDAGGRIDEARQ